MAKPSCTVLELPLSTTPEARYEPMGVRNNPCQFSVAGSQYLNNAAEKHACCVGSKQPKRM